MYPFLLFILTLWPDYRWLPGNGPTLSAMPCFYFPVQREIFLLLGLFHLLCPDWPSGRWCPFWPKACDRICCLAPVPCALIWLWIASITDPCLGTDYSCNWRLPRPLLGYECSSDCHLPWPSLDTDTLLFAPCLGPFSWIMNMLLSAVFSDHCKLGIPPAPVVPAHSILVEPYNLNHLPNAACRHT